MPRGASVAPKAKRTKKSASDTLQDEGDAKSEVSKAASSATSVGLTPAMPTDDQIASVDKQDMATFVTLAKRSNNPDMLAAYDKYRTAARFDDTKRQIVALWKSDKDCKWWNSWNQSDVQEDTVAKEDLSGYGTK